MYIIFKEFGKYRLTTEENFLSRFRDGNKVTTFDGFNSAQQVIDYCVKYGKASADDYKVIEEEV